jgi:hypothetical protein
VAGALVAVPVVFAGATRAAAAGNSGDLLLSESFRGTTLDDPAFGVAGAGFTPCLTASTTTPAGSAVPACAAGGQAIAAGGDGSGSGALRLTDAGTNESGELLYNKPLPLDHGAVITFDFAMYGGTGADGIGFFLADGSQPTVTPGADGGSLGYAQKAGVVSSDSPGPGVPEGFLGLGLDEYGNYELDTEGRGSTGGNAGTAGAYDCPNANLGPFKTANEVGLRGPGNGYDGYCLLNSQALDQTTQSLRGQGPTRTANGTLNSAQIVVSPPGAGATVTVSLAFGVTGTARSYTQVFSVPEPADPPSTFKFGATASSGGKTDIHEIENLSVSSVTPLPAFTLAQGDTAGGVFEAGSSDTLTINPAVTGQDETLAPTVTDALPAGLTVAAVPAVAGYDCSATVVGSQQLSCTWNGALPLLAGQALPEIPLSVAVATTAVGALTATAAVTSDDALDGGATAPHTVQVVALPVAVADSASTAADTAVTIPVVSNDSGTGVLAPTVGTGPEHGTATVQPDGTVLYTPTPGYSGPDSFTYTDTDPRGGVSTPATVTIAVEPVSTPDAITVTYGTPYTAAGDTLTGNDLGSGLTLTGVTTTGSGSVVLHPDGSYTYAPAAGFTGTTGFTYTAIDASGQPETGTVTVTVLPAGPVANPDSGTTTTGVPLTNGTNLLANDTGTTPLTAALASAPAHGTVAVDPDGSYTYTPAAGFSGHDTYTYTATDPDGQVSAPATVSITVIPQAQDDAQSTPAGQPLVAAVPTAVGTGPFTYGVATGPAHGTLSVRPDGSYTYTPATGYLGPDSFTYSATDAAGVPSAPATISITVVEPAAPTAVADAGTTPAGQPLTDGTNLLDNDRGTGPLTATLASGPGHGTVTVEPDGSYTYTPAPGFSGTDTFTYTTTDAVKQVSPPATVTITVAPVAVADSYPVTGGTPLTVAAPGILANDLGTGLTVSSHTNPAHGLLVDNPDGSFTYTPRTGYTGPDSFTYTVTDASGGVSGSATVSLTVGAPTPPTANDDSATGTAGLPLSGSSVLANDTGAGPLTPTLVRAPADGTLRLAADGTYSYTPVAGFSGTDTFSYTDTDPYTQTSGPATVTITILPASEPDSATLTGGAPYSGTSVLANDSGTGLTAVLEAAPQHGTLTLNPDGTYVYTPTLGYDGPDTFTYRPVDADGNRGPVTTVSLDVVKPVAPVAKPDAGTATAGSPGTGPNLLDNDSGATPLTAVVATGPAHGTVTVEPDGTYVYTPAPGFSGTDSFTYTAQDPYRQSSSPTTVTITVAPAATPDSFDVVGGTTATRTLPTATGTGPFTDVVGTGPQHGTLTLDPDGTYTYTPNPGYVGPDSFTYTATGAGGTTSTAVTVGISVTQPPAPTGKPDTGSTAAGTPLAGASVLGNDSGSGPLTAAKASDPVHGTVTVAPGGTYTYTPAPGFSGTDSFTYVVTDAYQGVSSPVTVTITVVPVAVADTATTPEDSTLTGTSVLANDLGSGLTAVLAPGPAHGTLTLEPDGTYTYVPDRGYVGPDSFTYLATGAGGTSTVATVSITVTGLKPVVTGGTSQTVTVGGTLAPITVTPPTGTTVSTPDPGRLPPGVSLQPTGTFTGTPTTPGTYTFPVTVTDAGGTTTVEAVIVVRAAPTAPGAPAPAGTTTPPAATATLPFTGGPIGGLLAIGLTLVAAGALLRSTARQRRRHA